jgi:hypothetical protein
MDFERDLFEDLNNDEYNAEVPYELKPECILVDKVFDSCFHRESEPSKIIDLPADRKFVLSDVIYGPGFIVEGTLKITPIRKNFARVRFCFRVPFTVKLQADGSRSLDDKISINDYVEFCKDIEVFLPNAAPEFSFRIVIDTRSETLNSDMVGKQLILSIGVFIVVKVVGTVQLLIQSLGYCPPPRQCVEMTPEDVCLQFHQRPLPEFFPMQMDQIIYSKE